MKNFFLIILSYFLLFSNVNAETFSAALKKAYNNNLELQYRGRIRELKDLKPVQDRESELLTAMKMISKTGNGPKEQFPSMGCSIKWFK